MRILLVEDDEKLGEAIKTGLVKKGYSVDHIMDGEQALNKILLSHADFDLVILDLDLPKMGGIEVSKNVREAKIGIPILILTANGETETKVDLLLHGVDDYLAKPFSFEELNARIQAILRRPPETLPDVIKISDIELNSAEHKALRRGKDLYLTLKEFVLLEYFMRHPYKVVNREELLTHLWDFNFSSFSNVVDVHIKNLRKKLNTDAYPNVLETVRGVGYRFAP